MAEKKLPDIPLTIVAAAALIRSDGAILMQRRPDTSQHGGLWEFPGGKLEPGETLTGCLARELGEELGIAVDQANMMPCATSSVPHRGGALHLTLFTTRAWQGEPEAREGATLAWVAPERLDRLAMPPADVPLVAALLAQLAD